MKKNQLAALIATCLVAAGAHAASTLEVKTINFKVTSTGFFAWTGSNGTISTVARDQIGWQSAGTPDFGAWSNDTATIPGDNAASVTTAAGASASGTFSPGISTLNVSTSADGGFAQASRDWTGTFVLAAHAQVTFEWDAYAYGVNSGNTSGRSFVYDHDNEMAVNSSVKVGNQMRTFQYLATGAAQSADGFELGNGTTEHFSITFKNTSNTFAYSSFRSSIQAYTNDVTAPAVPEPESYALVLAGLGTAALLMRRRRA
jgi:hypothetical protein